MNLIILVSIIKKVSSLLCFHKHACSLSVPPITPNISVLPVINGQQLVSLTIIVDVSFLVLFWYTITKTKSTFSRPFYF